MIFGIIRVASLYPSTFPKCTMERNIGRTKFLNLRAVPGEGQKTLLLLEKEKKFMKKRILSLLLAVLMVAGMVPAAVFTVFAEEAGKTEQSSIDDPNALGELSITIKNIFKTRETKFNVSLTKIEDEAAPAAEDEDSSEKKADYETSFTSAAGAESANGYIFTGIAAGNYELVITAKGYQTYKQELKFTDTRIEIILYNSLGVNDGRKEADGLFGVMAYGDVTGDGVINKEDTDAITNVMNGAAAYNAKGETIPTADCNLNGYQDEANRQVVDLEDLTICVRNQGDNVPATVFHSASARSLLMKSKVEAEVDEGTTVKVTSAQGSDEAITLEQALVSPSADSVVALTPADESKPLGEDNAVQIALNIGTSGDSEDGEESKVVSTDAIVIRPPADSENKITAGTMTVEATDLKTGEDITVEVPMGTTAEEAKTPEVENPQPQVRAKAKKAMAARANESEQVTGKSTTESDGTITISLGKMVAIKRVSIRITGSSSGKLADIAKVEFLEDFGNRIPEPQLDIPTGVNATNTEADGLGYRSVTVTWEGAHNVTGYEIKISGPDFNKTMTSPDPKATFVGDSFNGTVSAFNTYTAQVRSVNGDWRSPWSEGFTWTVTTTRKPKTPEYVNVTPGINKLSLSWRKLWDTQGWIVYYKQVDDLKEAESYKGLTEAQLIEKGYQAQAVTTTSWTLPVAGNSKTYDFCVVGTNGNGHSGVSIHNAAASLTEAVAVMPMYKLINTKVDRTYTYTKDGEEKTETVNVFANHITSIGYSQGFGTQQYDVISENYKGKGWDPYALLDGNPNTYNKRAQWANGNIDVNLDGKYEINTIRIAYQHSDPYLFGYGEGSHIRYRNDNGNWVDVAFDVAHKADAQGKKYWEFTTRQPVNTNGIQIHLCAYNFSGGNPARIQEVRVYYYDSLEDEVAALFEDNMRTVLKSTVTEQVIDGLRTRANTADPISREDHPKKKNILADLDYAAQLLKDSTKLDPIIKVDNTITSKADGTQGFAQALSDYQPLGYVAGAGDTIVVYVSRPGLSRGAGANLNLIVTQYHPEVSAWQNTSIWLKAGRNEIQIPRIITKSEERGGSLYIRYTGNKGGEDYSIRVSGAHKIPMLNVKDVAEADRMSLITKYVSALSEYVNDNGGIQAMHEQKHDGSDNVNVNFTYKVDSCFLNSTEISMNNMFYSVPATQIWAGLGGASTSKTQKAEKLAAAIKAMEQEIDYFYQFKGLNKNEPANSKDRYPMQRLNIRYHRMFTGAFMYAGGKHIGIEWGSVPGLASTTPNLPDANGNPTYSGSWGGWGIAHEIGHCINTSAYQRVEVTNNVYGQLEKAITAGEKNENFRTSYNNVYKGVASGTVGHTGDLAVQLAMYWQIHLAYDNGDIRTLYNTAAEAQAALIYAKIDAIYRDNSKAKYPISLNSDSDNNFMRVVCAAAERDLLHFFRAWGFTPNQATIEYAAQYDQEERLIQYVNDNCRLYRMDGGKGANNLTVSASIKGVEGSVTTEDRVTLEITDSTGAGTDVLGYEIRRDGKVVAFVTKDASGTTTYTNVLTTENNKAFVYSVTAVDKLLNASDTAVLPEVKVKHGNVIAKDKWTITTNMIATTDEVPEKDGDSTNSENKEVDPEAETVSYVGALIDNDPNTVYYGAGPNSNNRPSVTISLGSVEQVTAMTFRPIPQSSGTTHVNVAEKGAESVYNNLEYTSSNSWNLTNFRLFNYRIEVSLDGQTWKTVKESGIYKPAGLSASNPNSWKLMDDVQYDEKTDTFTVYFNKFDENGDVDPFMYTYDAAFIRVTSTGMSQMGLAEIGLLGPTSDNVELEGYGTLDHDFYYTKDEDPNFMIPKGSYVFWGSYQGDPSYSVVELRGKGDAEHPNVILGGEQIVLAEVAKNGQLGNVTIGKWIYWLPENYKDPFDGTVSNAKDQIANYGIERIQAELYRVNDADTLEGERMTSNSLHINNLSNLDQIVSIAKDVEPMDRDKLPQDTTEQQIAVLMAEEDVSFAPVYSTMSYGLNFATFAAFNDDESDGDEIDPGMVNEVEPFSYTVETTEDHLLSVAGKPMNFKLTPVNAVMAMQTVVKFDNLDVLKDAVVEFDSDTVKDDVFVTAFVNKNTGEVRLYVISKSGLLDSSDVVCGTISLAEVNGLDRVNISAKINEVDSDGNLVANVVGNNRVLVNTYESEDFVAYVHNWVVTDIKYATCREEGKITYKCAHFDEEKHNAVWTETVPKTEHVFDRINGVIKCVVCNDSGEDVRFAPTEPGLWAGEWYLKGEKLNHGVVPEKAENGADVYRLYDKGAQITTPGLHAVKYGTVDGVEYFYPVYVMNNGNLAVGNVAAEASYELTYAKYDGTTVKDVTITLEASKFYVFSDSGMYEGVGESPKKEVAAREKYEEALKNLTTGENVTERISTSTAKSLAEFKPETKGTLPSGVTFYGTTVTINADAKTVTVKHKFKASTTAIAKKYGLSDFTKSGSYYYAEKTFSFATLANLDADYTVKINGEKWSITYHGLLSCAYDVLNDKNRSVNETNLMATIYDYYVATTTTTK